MKSRIGIYAATSALAMLLLLVAITSAYAQIVIIPEPYDMQWKTGTGFLVNSSTQIVINTSPDAKDTLTANQLQRKVWDITGFLPQIVEGGAGAPTSNVIAIGEPSRNTAVSSIIATWSEATGNTQRN
ncbi:MAG: hypothetical protein Q7N50_08660 [Armatimonadota bacterium]|nr:hypothetical protein [Armatimonadota bacterium]